MHALGHAQRALLGVISEGLDAIREAESSLNEPDAAPILGSDPVRFYIFIFIYVHAIYIYIYIYVCIDNIYCMYGCMYVCMYV